MICQGTLAPLSQGIMPIYWDMDSSLALYPLPDLIVIGDPSKSFETEHQGCTVVNTVGLIHIFKAILQWNILLKINFVFFSNRARFQNLDSPLKCMSPQRKSSKTPKYPMMTRHFISFRLKTFRNYNNRIRNLN